MVIRVGFIGAGLMGHRRAESARRVGFELGSFYDADPTACARFSNKFGVNLMAPDDVIDDSDVVVVATPNDTHARYALQALQSGARVLVEKPVAIKLSELSALRGENSDRLRAGFHLRHYPVIKRLRQLVQDGSLGEVQRVTLTYGSPRPVGFSDTWRASQRVAGGGVLMDQGVHLLDLAVYLLGTGNTRVESVNWGYDLGYAVEDTACALLRWRGAHVSVLCSWRWPQPRFAIRVDGTDGYAESSGLGGKYGPPVLRVNDLPLLNGTDPGDSVWADEWIEWLIRPAGIGSTGIDASELVARVYGA